MSEGKPSVPSGAPTTYKEALEWARFLDTRDGEVRREQINRLLEKEQIPDPALQGEGDEGEPGVELWISLLYQCYHPRALEQENEPEGVSLLSLLERHGYTEREAEDVLSGFFEGEIPQGRWAEGGKSADRSEIRARLRILANVSHLRSGLEDIVSFYFRSSNPYLAREAARCMGCHLHDSPEFVAYIRNYAEQKEVSLSKPIPLNGDRGRRRLVYVLSASLAEGNEPPVPGEDAMESLPFSLPGLEVKEGEVELVTERIPSDPVEIAGVLFALELLQQSSYTENMVRELVPGFLHILATREQPVTRQLVRQWGKVLVAHAITHSPRGEGATDLIRTWMEFRERVQSGARRDHRFDRTLNRLHLFDELIRTVVFAPDYLQDGVVDQMVEKNGPSLDALFFLQRFLTWNWRLNKIPPRQIEFLFSLVEEQLPGVNSRELSLVFRHLFVETDTESGDLSFQREKTALDVLGQLLAPLAQRSRWGQIQRDQRALRAFFLLDLTRHVSYPEPELKHLFEDIGLSTNLFSADRSGTGRRSGPFMQILLRLLSWEEPEPEPFLDSWTLHMLADEQVLLALIPSRRAGSSTVFLADAFEHQLRVLPGTKATFDPGRYLYRTLIRNPDPSFYRHLIDLTAERSYCKSDGSEVPVHEWVRYFYSLSRKLVQGERDKNTEDQALVGRPISQRNDDWLPQFEGSPSPFLRKVARLRTELSRISGSEGDPRRSLERLTGFLGYADVEAGEPGSLIAFQRALHGPEEPLLQSGYPAWQTDTCRELETFLSGKGEELDRYLNPLLPESPEQIDRSLQAAAGIREVLDRIEERTTATLPHFEQLYMEEVFDELREKVMKWADSLETVEQTWWEVVLEGIETEELNPLLDVVEERFPPDVRGEVIDIFWSRLWEQMSEPTGTSSADSTNSAGEDLWEKRRELLNRGIRVANRARKDGEIREEMRQVLLQSWIDLTRTALQKGEEKRALSLLTDDHFRPLRQQHEAVPLLSRAETWCYNRYLIWPTYQIRADRVDLEDGGGSSFAGSLLHFSGYYSMLWLSLMMGVIFLLDFGDPWTAMAEGGNWGDIWLNFAVAVGITYMYLLSDLGNKVKLVPGETFWNGVLPRAFRALLFLLLLLLYTGGVVVACWWLISGSGEVITGDHTVAHLVIWTAFGLFVGVFIGFIGMGLVKQDESFE